MLPSGDKTDANDPPELMDATFTVQDTEDSTCYPTGDKQLQTILLA